jgi:hypothetical protein
VQLYTGFVYGGPGTPHRIRRVGPGWVILHGMTVFGRQHPSLLRFARAFASSGNAVLIPEIDEWTRLRIHTAAVTDAVAAGAEYLKRQPGVEPGAIGVIGFSFGATQALVAAADERAAEVGRVVGFGGYCELDRFAEFMMTGEHEWHGERQRLDPDPYARWIVAGNYLTLIPGLEGMERVGRGLLRLAEESGRGGLYKPDSYVDPLKERLRAGFAREERALWDLFAPPAGRLPPDLAAARELASKLAEAGRSVEPLLEPRAAFARLRAQPVLAHGLADRLIPYTETLRLRDALPKRLGPSATVTRLFEHSAGAGRLPPHRYAVEVWRLLRFFNHALRPA